MDLQHRWALQSSIQALCEETLRTSRIGALNRKPEKQRAERLNTETVLLH